MSADRRTAERLIIMRQYSIGLLTRTFNCVHRKLSGHTKTFMEKNSSIRSKLGSSRVEDPTADLDKVKGYQEFTQLAPHIVKECTFVYTTIQDIINASKEMEDFFASLASGLAGFDIHVNPDITQSFLHVFTDYIKLHFLVSKFDEARTAVYCYLASMDSLRTPVEDSLVVKDYLFKVKDPVKFLQGKAVWDGVGQCLLECLNNLTFSAYNQWSEPDIIKKSRIFDLMADPDKLPQPLTKSENQKCFDACVIDKLSEWILLIYLIFPEYIAQEKVQAQLKLAFSDRFAVSLFRDIILEVRPLYDKLKVHKPNVSVRIKPQKIYSKIDGKVVGDRHMAMRILMLESLKSLIDVHDTLPGVVPVKLPVFMAALSLARSEVLWIFQHLVLKDKYHFMKPKHFFQSGNNRVAELMYYTQMLAKKLSSGQTSRMISEYYREKLDILSGEFEPLIEALKGQIDKGALDYVIYVKDQLNAVKQDQRVMVLEGLRLTWYRASAILSAAGQHRKNADCQKMIKTANQIVQYSRYYDFLVKEVERCSSFSDLWFYGQELALFFNAILQIFRRNNDSHIKADRSQCRYLLVFLKVFEQAMHNVHKQNPQEREFIGQEAVSKTEAYLKSASSFVKEACSNIVNSFSSLAERMDSDVLAAKLRSRQQGNENLPGQESLIQNEGKPETLSLRHRMDALADVCSAFRETITVVVFEKQLFPNAYLYDELVDFFRQQVNRLLMAGPNSEEIVRPSMYQARLAHLLRAYHLIGSHLNIEVEHMVRKVMFDECNDETLGHVSQPNYSHAMKPNARKDVKGKLVHKISTYYRDLIQSCAEPKYRRVYSPFERGFYEISGRGDSCIQDFTTPNELQTLCRIIGPGGVRVLDCDMIQLSMNCITEIKVALVLNQVMVQNDTDVSSKQKWDSVAKTFRHLENLTKEATLLGLILCFRKELRAALKKVANENTPFMARSVALIQQRMNDHEVLHPRFNQLALDFGVVSPLTDTNMHTVVLQKLKEDSSDPEQEVQFFRKAIPVLFGFLFTSNAWKNVRFDVPTGALSNNGLCIAHTLQLLLDALTYGNNRAQFSRDLKLKFLRFASITLLNMNSPSGRATYSAHKSKDLLCFLDYFIRLDDSLKVSDLEQAGVPYALIRCQYVRLYGAANEMTSEARIDMNNEDAQ